MNQLTLKSDGQHEVKMFRFPEYFFFFEYGLQLNQRTRTAIVSGEEPKIRVLFKGEIADFSGDAASWCEQNAEGVFKNYSTGEFTERTALGSLKSALEHFSHFVIEKHKIA